MKISKKFSHLNGEEYLIVHHNKLYEEIISIINNIPAVKFKTKISKEKRMKGANLFSPKELNKKFNNEFHNLNWKESRYSYYITLNRELMDKSILMSSKEQKSF